MVIGSWLLAASLIQAVPQPDAARAATVEIGGREIALVDGATAVRGAAATSDGRYVLYAHNLARYHLPATQMDRGWMNTAALSVYDVKAGKRINTVLLDDPDRGAANPWGVALNDRYLAVSHAGTHEVSLIDRERFFKALADAEGELIHDLGFMRRVARRRIALSGKGPRGLRFRADGKLAVELYFAEATAIIDPETGLVEEPVLEGGLSPAVRADPVRLGEYYFNDANCCFQGWQSCASCHPDGTTDGLTWDFPFSGGGLGHPEETPNLVTMKSFMTRRTRQGDFHILLHQASAAIGRAVEAYVERLRGGK